MKYLKYAVLPLASLSTFALSTYGQTTIAFTDAERVNESGGSGSWFYSGATDALLAGNASSGNTVFETALIFDISSFDAEISSASSITLNVAYSAKLGDGQDVTAYLVGTNSSSLGSVGMDADTAHGIATTGTSAGTILAGDFSVTGGVASYDVTSIVQSQTTFDYVAVLLTSGITADTSSTAHDIQFYRKNTLSSEPNGGAYLTVVPEPQAFGLIAGSLGFAWLMLRRRR
tara:strand:- start:6066 stop:6758 length:693 start_codon:yes stop_codon:yes gene_type:complete